MCMCACVCVCAYVCVFVCVAVATSELALARTTVSTLEAERSTLTLRVSDLSSRANAATASLDRATAELADQRALRQTAEEAAQLCKAHLTRLQQQVAAQQQAHAQQVQSLQRDATAAAAAAAAAAVAAANAAAGSRDGKLSSRVLCSSCGACVGGDSVSTSSLDELAAGSSTSDGATRQCLSPIRLSDGPASPLLGPSAPSLSVGPLSERNSSSGSTSSTGMPSGVCRAVVESAAGVPQALLQTCEKLSRECEVLRAEKTALLERASPESSLHRVRSYVWVWMCVFEGGGRGDMSCSNVDAQSCLHRFCVGNLCVVGVMGVHVVVVRVIRVQLSVFHVGLV